MGYPKYYSRLNCFCSHYSEIAFRNFYRAKQKYLNYSKAESNYDIFSESTLIDQLSIISVVFSHMAIESFLNDYAAACLGDNEFYENFDKLDYLGKLQLICNFILKTKLDKGKEPYNSLQKLKKLRNSYIHNKSVEFDLSKLQNDCEIDDISFDVQYQTRLKYFKEMYKEAKTGIEAMVEIANYFDNRDDNVHAYFRFFGFITAPIELEASDIKKELKTLGLKNEIQI